MTGDLEESRGSPVLWYLLAGIETGVLGGLVSLAWLALCSHWMGQSIWTVPASIGSALRDAPALHRGPNAAVLAGVALQLCVTGSLGALFGLVVREGEGFRRVVVLGLLAGFAGYQLCHSVISGGAWLPPASPALERLSLAAWILFGAFLCLYPRLLRSNRRKLVLHP